MAVGASFIGAQRSSSGCENVGEDQCSVQYLRGSPRVHVIKVSLKNSEPWYSTSKPSLAETQPTFHNSSGSKRFKKRLEIFIFGCVFRGGV